MFEKMTLTELREALDTGKTTSVELTKYFLGRIKKDTTNSFITVFEQTAVEQAEKADRLIAEGKAKPLTGIPVAVKDNICTKDQLTTCASHMLYNFKPPYDATVMEKLHEQGAVILGKTNMDEFAMGGASQSSYYGGVKNPVDETRVPGGSSGGSAAAVAAGLAPCALGSDTGGSIRQPSSFCGITGIKPTYGAVSRYGLVAFASSLDQIGSLAKNAKDCGLVLEAVAGYDRWDGTSAHCDTDYLSKIGMSFEGKVVGLPKEFFGEGVDKEVAETVLRAAEFYRSKGAILKEASLPTLEYAIPAYYLLACAEAASNLARFDGVKYGYHSEKGETFGENISFTRAEGFGDEVKRRILLGNYALCSGFYDAYYKKALQIRRRLVDEYAEIFKECDFIITPTAPTTAPKIGFSGGDPVKEYLGDLCTVTVNIAYLPAINTTCGYDKNGLPIGMSIVGKPFDEAQIIAAADAFEASFVRKEAE